MVAELPPSSVVEDPAPLAVEGPGWPDAGWCDAADDERPGRAWATAAVSTPPAISDPTARKRVPVLMRRSPMSRLAPVGI